MPYKANAEIITKKREFLIHVIGRAWLMDHTAFSNDLVAIW